MTYEEYLQSQGVVYIPGDSETPGNYAIRTENADGTGYDFNIVGLNDERLLGGYNDLLRQQAQATPVASLLDATPTPIATVAPTPTTTPATTVATTVTPAPKSIEEYLQQQGYVYRPENRVETDGGMSGNFGGYGKYRTVGGGEVPEEQVFDEIERSDVAKYYEDPSRFTATRDTKFGQGINTFNEGNENQKRILDQINTGQLYISPRLVAGKISGEAERGGEGYREETVYDLRDSRTGEYVQQQVKAIDAEKGIFNIVADDPNSSGFFNNYVTTDPKGFVNPVVSQEQSQYQSKANSSANFYRNVAGGLLSMTGLAFPGVAEAIAGATTLGTVGSNVALNTAINAIKQGLTGNIDPLALATSAALSYGAGNLGADVAPLGNEFAGMTSADLASLDATGLINSFADAGLTASEIDQLTNLAPETGTQFDAYTSPIDTPVIGQPYDVSPLTDPVTGEPFGTIEDPLVDNYMDGFTSVSETGLATLPDEGMQTDLPGTTLLEEIGLYTDGFDPAPRYDFSPETPVLDVSPELDPTGSLATSSGFGITPRQLLAGANIAKSLLGGSQESAAAPATQFRGTRMPSGQVDYSGILGLLQMQSPQRRSLLG